MNRKSTAVVKGLVFGLCVAGLCAVVWIRSRDVGAGRTGLGPSFSFDMERHLSVDPSLVRYEEAEPIAHGLDSATTLATGNGGRIYVGGPQVILVLDSAGHSLSRVAVEGVPTCLAIDTHGTIFAGVGNHVEVFDAKGLRVAAWDAVADDALPVSIALRGDDVFVGDARQGQVLRYDGAGVQVDSIQGFVLFSSPILGMDVDPQQTLWVANPGARELRGYDENGVLVESWSKPGRTIDAFSGCCNPVDIAIRADGNIVTSEKNIVRVKVVSPSGELVAVVAGPGDFDQGITDLDIAVDPRGRVLVLDPVRKSVRVFVEKES